MKIAEVVPSVDQQRFNAILLHGYPRGDVLMNMWADLHCSCRGDLSCRSSFIPGDGVTFPVRNTA